MTEKEKDLLVKDLCPRLPYGVVCQVDDGAAGLNDGKLVEIDISKELVRFDADYYWDAYIDDIKPYLFPLSSMTKEQEDEWDDLYIKPLCERLNPHTRKEDLMLRAKAGYAATFWLMENHFDYLGLIPMGLAKDATNLNIY